MRFSKKIFSLLLAFAIAATTLLAVRIYAAEADTTRYVTLDVADGPIVLYTDRYAQNGVEHGGFACENTMYTFTGLRNRTDSALVISHTDEDAPAVTFNVVFKDLAILGEDWCSVVSFVSTRGGAVDGGTAPLTVNLRLEGRNYLGGHSHPGLNGNATVNISAAPGSHSTFTAEYGSTPEAFGAALTLTKVGTYDVKVGNETAELAAGQTAKPVVITGQDPAVIVKAQIDALPAAADVTSSDRDAIAAARTAYDALPADAQAGIDADTLRHLTDDEAALSAAEAPAANADAPKSAKNLTALWVVLAFAAGAGGAVAIMIVIDKKKTPPASGGADANADGRPQSEEDGQS